MKHIIKLFTSIMIALYLTTCNIPPVNSSYVPQTQNTPPKIVLITIDGVRWQEIFYGTDSNLYSESYLPPRDLIPNIYNYFVDHGSAFGKNSNIIASGTNHISLPGYLEMMRGFPTTDCITNLCEPELNTTLIDHYQNVAMFSSWDTVRKSTTQFPEKYIINSGRNYRTSKYQALPIEDNQSFNNNVGHFDYRPDEFTIQTTLNYLNIEKPEFLWVSLGDTDEYAHLGNYEKYISALKKADNFIGEMIQQYDENTVFVITTDHGRSKDWTSHGYDSESSRVWLMMYGKNIPVNHFVKFNQTKSLSNLMPTILKITHGINSEDSLI